MNKEHIGSNFDDFLKKEDFKDITSAFDDLVKWQNEEIQRLKKALEDVREFTKKYYLSDKKLLATGIEINPYGAIIEIQDKINEVLKDEY